MSHPGYIPPFGYVMNGCAQPVNTTPFSVSVKKKLSLRLPMFHLELIDIQKSHKIDTMGIWKILYSVTLNPLR